jgi:hypothetical protein
MIQNPNLTCLVVPHSSVSQPLHNASNASGDLSEATLNLLTALPLIWPPPGAEESPKQF